jgi:methylphosphotriester-DNA--protein-cysteine methyltransferase
MADGARWSQVVARAATADGMFLYGVKSTKCFCRPTCKARLPRRANVIFFDSPEQAQAAGYRSCKRCQPLLPVYRPEADKIQKACDFLDSLPDHAPLPGLERLAREAGLTKHHFHRLFKRETGLTPREYAISRRADNNSEATTSSVMTPITPFAVDSIASEIVRDEGNLGAMFDRDQDPFADLKMPSSQEVRDMFIYYQITATTYGSLLVAFHNRNVCMLELGSEQELTECLEEEYPVDLYIHSPISVAPEADTFSQQVQSFIEGLEKPCGKLLSVPLRLRLLGSTMGV